MRSIMSGLIEVIERHATLREFICTDCKENNSEAKVDERFRNWCILNPEAYFKSLRSGNTPSAVDCLIPIECRNDNYVYFLIELKSAPKDLDREYANIYKKFEDTLDKFIFGEFAKVFKVDTLKRIELLVVHKIAKKDRHLLEKRFLIPVRRANRNLHIQLHLSPHTIKKR